MKTPRILTVVGILAIVGVVVAGFIAGSPVLGVVLAAVLAGARSLFGMMRRGTKAVGSAPLSGGTPANMDPFTLNEPWRHFVRDALAAQRRYGETLSVARPGPIRDRLSEIGQRLDEGVSQVWATAQQGQNLRRARRAIDTEVLQSRLIDAQAAARATPELSLDTTAARTVSSLEGQLASAGRLDEVTGQAEAKLKLLQAQLDETVARAAEMAAQATDSAALGTLGDDVDHLVEEMEALRLALDETGALGAAGA